jgi:GMP synthase (glutamine-hydrolysing)
MTKLWIIKTGTTLPEVARGRGDFEDWFAGGLGLPSHEIWVADVHRGTPLPDPRSAPAVVVTGSAAMVSAREPWSERTAQWLAEAVSADRPILAVCYGHQLLAHGLGGTVGANPRGREMGTVAVTQGTRAKDDPLFDGLPPVLQVQATHKESVLRLPEGAVALAGNPHDPYQAFRVGRRAWGVQFHPEFDADIIRGYIQGRGDALRAEGLDPEVLDAGARDSDDGARLLRRFAHIAWGAGP